MTTNERLSEGTFKKCDMHVHSSSCYSRSYGEESFLSSVLSSDLDVIAVTDHNSIDVELLTRLQSDLSMKRKKLIGGVEINVKLKPDTISAYNLAPAEGRRGAYFHAIVWFAPDKAAEMSSIVDDLFIAAILGAQDKDKSTEKALRALPRKQFSKRTEGIAIYLEDFQERASTIPYFFIPHENKDRSLSDYLPNGPRSNPLYANRTYKDRLFYYSHAMAVEGGEKSRKHISEGLAKELHTTVAALFFSDAETVEEIGSEYTWIDFDGDLDSLLLAISDPESRIKTSDERPGLPQTNTATFLESVTFNMLTDGDGSDVHTTSLRFSPGYNGIVGPRGSGKSLLACLLSGKGLDTYGRFVDADSVKFTAHGGITIADRPSCLYLGQGELEGIYKDGRYEDIPFLGARVTPLREDAERESDKAKTRLIEILDMEKKLLLTFCEKYTSGPIHMDHLNTEMPSGITIQEPATPPKDRPQIDRAKSSLTVTEGSLEAAKKEIESISFESSYPEDAELFAALEDEVRSIGADILTAKSRVARLLALLDEVDPSWFRMREQLVSLFTETLTVYNRSSDSTTLTQYNKQANNASSFLNDLLELRLSLNYLNEEAQSAYGKMRRPIEPVKLTNAEESIEVSLVFSEEATFDDAIADLMNSSTCRSHQVLVEAFLCQSDTDKMHKKFNGKKFKSCARQDLKAHYSRFFEQLEATVSASANLKPHITVAGKPIDEMSPGMKAQALLKLFLNDEVVTGKWMYIVLDQPEDNLDVATIKDFLINRLKKLKLNVQFFVVSHSAPVIVNGDARTVIVCENNDGVISYSNGAMNDGPIKQSIADVLDGGERYLKMRLNKYNFQIGDKR